MAISNIVHDANSKMLVVNMFQVISIQEKSREMIPDVKRSLCKVSMVKSNLEKSISEIENEITNIHAEVKQYSNDILSYFMEVSGKLQVVNCFA